MDGGGRGDLRPVEEALSSAEGLRMTQSFQKSLIKEYALNRIGILNMI